MRKYFYIGIAALLIFFAGFYVGSRTISQFQGIRLVQGEEQHLSVVVPIPNESKPKSPDLPVKHDTIQIDKKVYFSQVVDTAAIIANYIAERKYVIPIFDNKDSGKLSINATVQYNKIADMSYTFLPIYKEIIIKDKKPFQVIVGASYNTFNYVTVSTEIFRYNTGIEVGYVTDFRNKGIELGLRYKF